MGTQSNTLCMRMVYGYKVDVLRPYSLNHINLPSSCHVFFLRRTRRKASIQRCFEFIEYHAQDVTLCGVTRISASMKMKIVTELFLHLIV